MVKEKKNFDPFKGNKINQTFKSPFIDEFNEWRENCQGISGGALKTKKVPNLYMFLKRHFTKTRTGSRNADFVGEGANDAITFIERIVDNNLFTVGNARIIKQLAKVLKSYKDTGEDAGGEGIAADPAFILFTEKRKGRTGQRLRDIEVQGHYMTENYAGPNKVPDDWLAGNNPPHQALFSKTETEYAKPRGLLYIMEDATKDLDNRTMDGFADIEVEVNRIPEGFDASDFEQLGEIEKYFDKVVRNQAFWSQGGKLLVKKLRQDFEARQFQLTEKDQATIRELARLGKRNETGSIAGKITTFRLVATATPLITLVERALDRKGTNKAPNGFRAWQNATKRGFDYRKTRREKFGEDAQGNLDNKVISKMWQQYLWR